MDTSIPRIIVPFGRSGSGKSTLIKNLQKEHFPSGSWITSSTTREKRPDDSAGEYEYLTRKQFDTLDSEGAFAWTQRIGHTYYGTRATRLDVAAKSGIWFLILTPNSLAKLAEEVLKRNSDASLTFFYIEVKDAEILRERLKRRYGDETKAQEKLLGDQHWPEQIATLKSLGKLPRFTVLNGKADPDELAADVTHWLRAQ